jgi:tRNA uridine 5-carbamoylmethylation protein Kti12
MKIAYILRGVPGSGKTTLARQLANGIGAIHSTDDFFVLNGEYRFDGRKLQEYHDLNYEAFCRSLAKDIPIVICDNTNVKRSHMKRYLDAAKKAGYFTAIFSLPHPSAEVAANRTTHKVPAATIQRIIDQWEN